MNFFRISFILSLCILFAFPARAEKLIWKREFVEENCKEYKEPTPPEGDALVFKCPSKIGPPMWRVYHEAVRSAYGFGTVANFANYLFTTRRGNWPVEWGGVMVGKKFVPRVVIARFNFSDDGGQAERSSLMVFRLLADGTSCALPGVETGARENIVARKIAQDPKAQCIGKGSD